MAGQEPGHQARAAPPRVPEPVQVDDRPARRTRGTARPSAEQDARAPEVGLGASRGRRLRHRVPRGMQQSPRADGRQLRPHADGRDAGNAPEDREDPHAEPNRSFHAVSISNTAPPDLKVRPTSDPPDRKVRPTSDPLDLKVRPTTLYRATTPM